MARQARVFTSSFLVETIGTDNHLEPLDQLIALEDGTVEVEADDSSLNHYDWETGETANYPDGHDDEDDYDPLITGIMIDGVDLADYEGLIFKAPPDMPATNEEATTPDADELPPCDTASYEPIRRDWEKLRGNAGKRNEGKCQIRLTRSIRTLRKQQRVVQLESFDEDTRVSNKAHKASARALRYADACGS
jgi:hypothetical protein